MNPYSCPKCKAPVEGVADKFRCPSCNIPLKVVKPLFKSDTRISITVDFEESQKKEPPQKLDN